MQILIPFHNKNIKVIKCWNAYKMDKRNILQA